MKKMKEEYKFDYDESWDRLMISRKKESDVMDGSIRVLNMIFDFTTKGKVANIELLNASDYLESLGVDSRILNKITEAEFSFQQMGGGYLVSIVLKSGKEVVGIPYNIHLPSGKQIIPNLP